MAESLRAFIGVDELSVVSAQYKKNNSSIVNEAFLSVEADSNVIIGASVDVKKSDGSTNVFNGRVHDISEPNVYVTSLLSNGYELVNQYVEKVYENISPEDLIKDVVNNFTSNLTFDDTSPSSGVVLEEYIAQGYAIDIVRDALQVLLWRMTISQSDVVRVAPEGEGSVSKVFTNGDGFLLTNFSRSDESVINHVRVEAGFELPRRIEDLSGTGTTFDLSSRPESSVRVLVSGSEVSPDTYQIKPESTPPQIIFTSSVTDPVVEYTYRRRIVVEDENEDSISLYGRVFKRIDAPYLLTRSDARLFARSIVSEFGSEEVVVDGELEGLDFSVDVNDRGRLIDSLRNKNLVLVVNELVYDYDRGVTVVKLGRRDFDFVTWQVGVQDRIKQIERRFTSAEEKTFVRTFSTNLSVVLEGGTFEEGISVMSANDSFIPAHMTLSYPRVSEDVECDCSNNDYHLTWSGTSVGGAQYVKAGARLYCGSFNGDREVSDSSVSISGVRNVCFFINPSILGFFIGVIRLSSTVSISLSSSGDIVISGVTNEEVFVDLVESPTVSNDRFYFVSISSDSFTADDISLGAGGAYSGLLDEVMLFNKVLSLTEQEHIKDKKLYIGQALYETNLLAYWSFDNPLTGDRTEDITEDFFA